MIKQTIALVLQCTIRRVLADQLPNCGEARFPQIFGSQENIGQDKINGVDINKPTNTVVAVGHFTDKSMARDADGEFDQNFENIEYATIPSIAIYPDKGDGEPTYFTVMFGEEGSFLDVSVLKDFQVPYVGSGLDEYLFHWHVNDFDLNSQFFFATIGATEHQTIEEMKTQRLFIFKVSQDTDAFYDMTLHQQFSFTLPQFFVINNEIPFLLNFQLAKVNSPHYNQAFPNTQYQPIISLHYPTENVIGGIYFAGGALQIGLLTPFLYEFETEYYQATITETIQGTSVHNMKWFNGILYACGGFYERAASENRAAILAYNPGTYPISFAGAVAVEVQGSFEYFRDLTFYSADGNNYILTMAWKPQQTHDIAIYRYKQLSGEYKSWEISILDYDVQPRPVAIDASENGTIYMILEKECENCSLHSIIQLEWSFLENGLLTEIIQQNVPGQILYIAGTSQFKLLDAKYFPDDTGMMSHVVYSLGLDFFIFTDGSEPAGYHPTYAPNMFSLLSTTQDKDCDAMVSWTDIVLADVTFTEEIILTHNDDQLQANTVINGVPDFFTTVASETVIQHSLLHYSTNQLKLFWQECVQNTASEVIIDEQSHPLNEVVLIMANLLYEESVITSEEVDPLMFMINPSEDLLGIYTDVCMDTKVIYSHMEISMMIDGEKFDELVLGLGPPNPCSRRLQGDPNDYEYASNSTICSLEEIAQSMHANSFRDDNNSPNYTVNVQPSPSTHLAGQQIKVKYVTETLNGVYEAENITIEFTAPWSNLEQEVDMNNFGLLNPPNPTYTLSLDESQDLVFGIDDSYLDSSSLAPWMDVTIDGVSVKDCRGDECPVILMADTFSGSIQCTEEVFEEYVNDYLQSMLELPDEGDDEYLVLDELIFYIEILLYENLNMPATVSYQSELRCETEQYYTEDEIPALAALFKEPEEEDEPEEPVEPEEPLPPEEPIEEEEEEEEEEGEDPCKEPGVECDDCGNLITDEGFMDEQGCWNDLSNYEEDPEALAAVTEALANQGNQQVQGGMAISPGAAADNYSEADALAMSNFDILQWLKSKGIGGDGLDENSRRLFMLSLEAKYSVPKQVAVNQKGQITIGFSSPLKDMKYDAIQRKFVWLYSGARRRLTDQEHEMLSLMAKEMRWLEEDDAGPSQDGSNSNSTQPVEVSENEQIANLLKVTSSVEVQLIPWQTTYLEMKAFNWTMITIDERTLEFRFFFENPPFVSTDEKPDTMKITFLNTPFYLVPQDDNKSSIPSGYQVPITLPPQMAIGDGLLAISPEDAQSGIITLIASNSWVGFVFGVSMQPLFNMINSLQITALLPLNNIALPANAMDLFKVLVMIVAFDFFALYDYWNPGFTGTGPYSDKFEWFGFDSVNYIEDLGFFITLLILILALQVVMHVLLSICTRNLLPFFVHQTLISRINHVFNKAGKIRQTFDIVAIKQGAIRFMMETYVELLIAAFIAFKMFEIQSIWNTADMVAVAVHFIFIGIIAYFFIFVCWFVCIKVKPLNRMKNKERKELILKLSTKNNGNEMINEKSNKPDKEVTEEEYDVYEPLLAGLKDYEQSSSFVSLFFILRRIILVFSVILLEEDKWQWLQMVLFMLSSLAMLIFECATSPFDSAYQNRIEILNELNVLLVSYLGCQILYSSWSPLQLFELGNCINQVILGGILINMVLILGSMVVELKRKFLTARKKFVMKRRDKKLQRKSTLDLKKEQRKQIKQYAKEVVASSREKLQNEEQNMFIEVSGESLCSSELQSEEKKKEELIPIQRTDYLRQTQHSNGDESERLQLIETQAKQQVDINFDSAEGDLSNGLIPMPIREQTKLIESTPALGRIKEYNMTKSTVTVPEIPVVMSKQSKEILQQFENSQPEIKNEQVDSAHKSNKGQKYESMDALIARILKSTPRTEIKPQPQQQTTSEQEAPLHHANPFFAPPRTAQPYVRQVNISNKHSHDHDSSWTWSTVSEGQAEVEADEEMPDDFKIPSINNQKTIWADRDNDTALGLRSQEPKVKTEQQVNDVEFDDVVNKILKQETEFVERSDDESLQ